METKNNFDSLRMINRNLNKNYYMKQDHIEQLFQKLKNGEKS